LLLLLMVVMVRMSEESISAAGNKDRAVVAARIYVEISHLGLLASDSAPG